MAEPFNPYHKWLGIAPKDQPPHHYRLLGIDLFEDDRDVIDAAANRVMSYLKELATGDAAAHSQQIMNEVMQARMCLLKPKKKATYDRELRAVLSTENPQPPTTMPPRVATADATSSGPTVGITVVESATKARYRRRPTWVLAAVGGGAPVLAAVVLAVFLISSNRGQPDKNTLAGGQSDTPVPGVGEPTDDRKTKSVVPSEPRLSDQPFKHVESEGSPAPDGSADRLGEDQANEASEGPAPTTVAGGPSVTDGAVDEPAGNTGSSVVPPAAEPTDSRESGLPVAVLSPEPLPSAEDQARATVVVLEKFGKEIDDATAVENRIATARSMLQAAGDANENASTRFVLLVEAHKLAIAAGDAALVNETMDGIVRNFTIDKLEPNASLLNTKAVVLEELGRRANTSEDLAMVAESALALTGQAAADGQADLAKRVASMALATARKAGESELVRKATLRLVELQ